VPIEAPLQLVINNYLSTRKARHPRGKLGPSSPLSSTPRRTSPTGRSPVPGPPVLPLGRRRCPGPKGALVHALRHTMATRLAEDGASASEIQHILGHESLNTSQTYIDATPTSNERLSGPTARTVR